MKKETSVKGLLGDLLSGMRAEVVVDSCKNIAAVAGFDHKQSFELYKMVIRHVNKVIDEKIAKTSKKNTKKAVKKTK